MYFKKFGIPKKFMYENAIKIVWRNQKLCSFYQKYGSFRGKNFVLLLAKFGAPSSSEILVTLATQLADSPQ